MRTRQTIQNKNQINQKFSLQVMRRKKSFAVENELNWLKLVKKKLN